MSQAGFFRYFEAKYKSTRCVVNNKPDDSATEALGFIQLNGAFVVLGIGAGTSFIIFIIEFVIFKITAHCNQSTQVASNFR